MSHDNVTSRNAVIKCFRCPDHNAPSNAGGPTQSEGRNIESTINIDGPSNSGIRTHTPAIEYANVVDNFTETKVIMQFGNYYWGRSGCGRFKSDNDTPSGTASEDTIYKSTIKVDICEGSGTCSSPLKPLSKTKTSYSLDENQFCVSSGEVLQPCSDNEDCSNPSTFTRYYEFEDPVSGSDEWDTFDALDDTYKNYTFDGELKGNSSDLGIISNNGFSRTWIQNKTFVDTNGDPFGNLNGANPKVAFKCLNLIIGMPYIFGYNIYKSTEASGDNFTVTKVRDSFVATDIKKEFGSFAEDWEGETDEDNYNAMSSVSLPTADGRYRIGAVGLILDWDGFDNCESWKPST